MTSKQARRQGRPPVDSFETFLPSDAKIRQPKASKPKIPMLPKQMHAPKAKEKKANQIDVPVTPRSKWPWRRKRWILTAAQRLEAMDTWERMGADAGALAIVAERAPDVLEALLHGASIPGSPGFNDRAVILRFLNLGHLLKGAGPGAAEADRRIDALGDRLAAKLMARAGHGSVRQAKVIEADVQADSDFAQVTHETHDLVREAEPAVEPVAVAAMSEPAKADALDEMDWSG